MYRENMFSELNNRPTSRHYALHRRAAPYSRSAPGYAGAHALFSTMPTTRTMPTTKSSKTHTRRNQTPVLWGIVETTPNFDDIEVLNKQRAELLKNLKLERDLNIQLETRLAKAKEHNERQRRKLEEARIRDATASLLDKFRAAAASLEDEDDYSRIVNSQYQDVPNFEEYGQHNAPNPARDVKELQPLVMRRPAPQNEVMVQPLPVVYDGDVVTVGGGPQFVLPKGLSFDAMPRDTVRDFMLKHLVDDPLGHYNDKDIDEHDSN